MKRPPMLMHLRFQGEDRVFGLWLPLFLLLPLALVVFIILSPLILIAVIVLWPSCLGKSALLVLKAACEMFWSIRDLKVNIQGSNQYVYISVI
jgi:hypothetical protein